MNPNLPTGETFSDGSDIPPELSAPAMPSMNEQRVPLAALQQPDDQEALVTPEVGDMVTYTVEGRVSRIEGDVAVVTAESANGKPMQEEAAETPAQEGGETESYESLEAQAKGMVI